MSKVFWSCSQPHFLNAHEDYCNPTLPFYLLSSDQTWERNLIKTHAQARQDWYLSINNKHIITRTCVRNNQTIVDSLSNLLYVVNTIKISHQFCSLFPFFNRQPPFCSPREKVVYCESVPRCRQNFVCLHFIPTTPHHPIYCKSISIVKGTSKRFKFSP